MAKKRESRKEINHEEHDFTKPIDITKLGSEDDPCFGKHHDLMAEECKVCGDSEFCAIVKAQNLHKERLDIESKQRFKDIEEAEQEENKKRELIKKECIELFDKGLPKMKIVLKLSKKHSVPKDLVKSIYKQI